MNYEEFHRRSIDDPEGFWGEQAKLIYWNKPPQKFGTTASHRFASGLSAAKPICVTTPWTGIWPTALISGR